MPIVKVRTNRQVTIPKKIFDELGLKEGDFVDVKRAKRSIVIKPKKLVDADAWDTLTPEEEEEVEEGFEQIERGEYVTWKDLKKELRL